MSVVTVTAKKPTTKSFPCSLCKSSYVHASGLSKHMKQKHQLPIHAEDEDEEQQDVQAETKE